MRNYKRKGPRPWRDKDKRMTAAVRLRDESKSLREIAKELAVSHQTVANDLARWDREHANVIPLSKPTVKTDPVRGEIRHPDLTALPAVASLGDRRK